MMKGTEDHYIEVSLTNPCNGSDITVAPLVQRAEEEEIAVEDKRVMEVEDIRSPKAVRKRGNGPN